MPQIYAEFFFSKIFLYPLCFIFKALNYLNIPQKAKSLRYSSYINNISTVGKTFALILIIITGMINLTRGQVESFEDGFTPINDGYTVTIGGIASGKIKA